MLRKVVPLVILSLGALLQTSPVPLRALSLESAGLARVSIPADGIPVLPLTQADFNGDSRLETIRVTDGRAEILSGGQAAWQSPEAWTVLQAEITDLNQDDTPELTLLVWRPFRPWPVDQWLPHGGRIDSFQDANGQSCHIILIGWKRGAYRELWAGSAMAEPVRAFAAADFNGDNHQELVTLEGTYAGSRSAAARSLKVWEWNGFGFTVVSEVKGTFSKMTLIQAGDGRILILVP